MNQKFQLHSNNKHGYLQIDFAFVVLIFFFLFFFIHNLHKQKVDSFEGSIILNDLQADARDICFLLSSSSGFPFNWDLDVNSTKIFGLKNLNSNNLSLSKMQVFNISSNYFIIKDTMNYDENFNLRIIGLTSNLEYIRFGSLVELLDVYFAKSVCYANYNSEQVKLIVEVWR